jgi:hypothetical protein
MHQTPDVKAASTRNFKIKEWRMEFGAGSTRAFNFSGFHLDLLTFSVKYLGKRYLLVV